MKRSTIVFFIILALAVVAMIYSARRAQQVFKQQQQEEAKQAQDVPVTVTPVLKGDISEIIYLTGYIEPNDQVSVIAKLKSPGKLIQANVKEGDRVAKDQVLALVDQDEVGATYAPYPIKSPLSGTVAKIIDDRGAMISGQVPAAVIINIDQVKVRTSVIEQDYGLIKIGLPARVYTEAFPGRSFEGKITKIDPTLDPFAHTAGIEIMMPNSDHALRPGMFANINIAADVHKGALILPKNAVVKRQSLDTVYKVDNNVTKMQKVKLGYYDMNNFEILEGVSDGDLIVSEQQSVLQDGVKVIIANKDQLKTAANQVNTNTMSDPKPETAKLTNSASTGK